jgi:hypothetical protein
MKRLATLTAIGLCLAAPAFAQTATEQEQLERQKAAPSTSSPAPAAQAPAGGQAAPAASSRSQSGTANQQQPAASSGSSSAQAPASSSQSQSATGNQNQPAQSRQAQQPAASGSGSSSAQAPASPSGSKSATTGQAQGKGQAASKQQPASQNKQAAPNAEAARSSSASVNVSINDTQRTRIAEVISSSKVRPIDVNFSIETGVVVPATVTLLPLPPRLVEIVPQYRGYRYFVTRDRIVIVEPRKKTIVTVIPAGSAARAQAPAPKAKVSFTEEQRAIIRKRTSSAAKPATTGSGAARLAIEQEVPATIELQEFPAEVVTEVPVVRSYRYFRQDDDLVVVDPAQRRVIEIIR